MWHLHVSDSAFCIHVHVQARESSLKQAESVDKEIDSIAQGE